jgi:putative ABC transport system permease protein
VGDTIHLKFQAGRSVDVPIGGIIEKNVMAFEINVPLAVVRQAGVERQDNVLNVVLDRGVDAAAVQKRLEDVVEDAPLLKVYDKASFAEDIRGQVNQLLFMIYGLLALAIIIAVIGIVNTLGLSVLERTREVGLLRAVGMTRRQLRRTITLESVAIAVLGAVLGMALGLVFGVLIRQVLSDDLTSLALPFGQLLVFAVIAVVVGVLAAVIPAVRASRLNVLAAIATE